MNPIKNFFREIWWALLHGKVGAFYLFILLIIVFSAANILFYFASTFPASCKICHYMKPYYDQWLSSSHHQTNCLKCHKFKPVLNMLNTLKYMTNTYNPRPIARIEDERCLQEECHPQRLLSGVVSYKGNIIFDHEDHVGKLKRGEKLKCVSCHSQIVQGEHIAVTEKVCYLCHFKGAAKGQSMTGCPSCHGTPTKIVEHEGFYFSHESYLKIGVGCNQCHIDVASGTGQVPMERCHSCHVERTEKAPESFFIHQIHVTDVGVNCFKCHEPIEHGEISMIQALEVKCESCHLKLHSYQKELYMGASGRGVPDTPSRMFSAQVACDGCHRKISGREKQNRIPRSLIRRNQRESCVICHGKGYDVMLNDWIREGSRLLKEVEPMISYAQDLLRKEKDKKAPIRQQAEVLAEDALYNFNLVRFGLPSHNIDYSYKLLKAAWEQSKLVIKMLQPSKISSLPEEPELFQQTGKYCTTFCHDRLGLPEELTFKDMEITFPHSLHALLLEIDCTDCHSPEKHKMRIITKEGCMDCHHGGQDRCGRCHHKEEKFYSGQYQTIFTKPQKDFMFEAGVPCLACHVLDRKEKNLEALRERCIRCHDKNYGKRLIEWERSIEERDIILTLLMDSVSEKLKNFSLPGELKEKWMKEFQSMAHDYDIVLEGNAMHNYEASIRIYGELTSRLRDLEKRLNTIKHQR